MRRLAPLLLACFLGFAAGCGSDKLEACTSCTCNCGDSIKTVTSTPPPCECASTCAASCGRTPISATCASKIEVDVCAQ